MYEELLYYIWEHRHYSGKLQNIKGEEITIIHPGQRNLHSGPDYFNSRIRIAGIEWAGNIEIHNKASDWYRHNHQKDKAYDNIILHVVYENDAKITKDDGSTIPQLCIKQNISTAMIYKYQKFMQSRHWIACSGQINKISPARISLWYPALASERLERKTEAIAHIYQNSKNDWESSFYILLAKNFGFKVNTLPFEMLARHLNLKELLKQQQQSFIIEALIFGMSGLIDESSRDKYAIELANEFSYQQSKLNLHPINPEMWKQGRLRPANSPHIRLAQFAAVMKSYNALFSKIIQNTKRETIHTILRQQTHHYWDSHYNFKKTSIKRKKTLGKSSADLLIINTIVPFLFFYGKKRHKPELCEQSLDLLTQLPSESNNITSKFKKMGLSCKTAMDSQALIELRKQYCTSSKCLRCRIGHQLLKPESKF